MKGQLIKGISLRFDIDRAKPAVSDVLREFLNDPGDNPGLLSIRIYDPTIDRALVMTSKKRIRIDRSLVQALESLDIDFSVMLE